MSGCKTVDLDELERNARILLDGADDPMDDGPALAISDPAVTLAMIARIRELRSALSRALDTLAFDADHYDTGTAPRFLEELRDLLKKDIVLP